MGVALWNCQHHRRFLISVSKAWCEAKASFSPSFIPEVLCLVSQLATTPACRAESDGIETHTGRKQNDAMLVAPFGRATCVNPTTAPVADDTAIGWNAKVAAETPNLCEVGSIPTRPAMPME